MKKISVILPCYNVETAIYLKYQRIVHQLKEMNVTFELIFIDNGSTDTTLDILQGITREDYNCNYISMQHSHSLLELYYLGCRIAVGDIISFMDMRHSEHVLSKLYTSLIENDCHIVGGASKTSDIKSKEHKERLVKMFYKSYICKTLEKDDHQSFRQQILKNTDIIWVPFVELQRNQETLPSLFLQHLRIFCGKRCSQRFIYIMIVVWIVLPLCMSYIHFYQSSIIELCILISTSLMILFVYHLFLANVSNLTLQKQVKASSYSKMVIS